MAVRDEAVTTGTADRQGDVRKRTAGQGTQANGAYSAQEVQEKSKEKVCYVEYCAAEAGLWEGYLSIFLERDELLTMWFFVLFRRLTRSSMSWTSMSF